MPPKLSTASALLALPFLPDTGWVLTEVALFLLFFLFSFLHLGPGLSGCLFPTLLLCSSCLLLYSHRSNCLSWHRMVYESTLRQ